ncbi:MAG TPA: hypothetical protein PLQ57_01650 [Saprospiraceae bacterium]|nr:hypothetical protein [Saprospiraceae bacterium]HRG19695.1 hypothetical protein [Saprospiraceae bacterium]HRG64873.1 hypothetical protein [Saprospiraceae bacterium]
MSVLDSVRVLIYRVHEKGLEVFLINNEMVEDPEIWNLPEGFYNQIKGHIASKGKNLIDLEPTVQSDGSEVKTLAVEGDWHDIPSIRGILKHDIKLAKKILKERLPGSEKGAYFAVKECFKKVLPQEYEAIKELKDIIADRNAVKNI